MLSTFPANFSAEFPYSGDHFPTFETAFPAWGFDPPVLFPFKEPAASNSGSDTLNPAPVTPESGSERKRKGSDKSSSGGSDDDRKQRRMLSNRESARRSRMRKQKYLEGLRNKACRLKATKQELMNRLRLVLLQNHLVCTENECLRSEVVVLGQTLWDTRQVLLARQLQQHLNPSAWPCNNNVTSINHLPNNL